MPKSKNGKRRWSITLNNPNDGKHGAAAANVFAQWVYDNRDIVRYCIVSDEHVDQESKTPHWQMYIEFFRPVRFSYVKKIPTLDRAHIESSWADGERNANYCSKENKPWFKYGKRGGAQGRRTDMEKCKAMIDAGCTEEELADEHFGSWVRYHKSFKAYKQLKTVRRRWQTEVIVRWGPPGSGKTRWVWENEPDVIDMWYRNSFWSPYNGEEVVLWDDFDPSCISRQEFLTLTDRYPAKIRQMNGWAEWVPKKIYITSNYDPQLWWNGDPAIMRRIKEVVRVSITSDTSVTVTKG